MDSPLNASAQRTKLLCSGVLFLAGCLSAVLGLFVLIDMHTGTRFMRFAQEGVPLHYNTAWGLFALGMGLLAYLTEHFVLSSVIGGSMNLFGFFSIIQIFLASELGLQKVIMKSSQVQVSVGAHLSPNSAVCFLLSGLALALIKRQQKWRATLIGLTSGSVVAISSVALFGYVADLQGGFTWGHYTPMPPVAAIAFFLIGIGLFAIALQEWVDKENTTIYWLPSQIAAFLFCTVVVLFSCLLQQEQRNAEKILRARISRFRMELEGRLQMQIDGLTHLASKWETMGATDPRAWEKEAQAEISHFPSYLSMERYGKDLAFQWSTSRDKEEDRIQKPIDKEFESQFLLVRRSREPLVLRNDLSERQFKRFRVAAPLFKNDRFDGFLVATYRMTPLVETALQDEAEAGISFALSDDVGEIFSWQENGEPDTFEEEQFLTLHGYQWKMRAWPSAALVKKEKTFLPQTLLVLGVMLSGVIAFFVYFAGISVKRNRELRAFQEETLRAKEEALKASQSKTEFLTNVSHEIRTPLNAIQGMTNLLVDTKLSADQRDCVDGIKFSADSLLSLINDVLDLAKIEAGKMELESTDFDVRKLLSAILDVFQLTSQQKGLSLKLDYPGEVPSVFRGDPHRLRQILTNLIGNAVKFTEKGWVKIAVEAIPRAENHYILKFLVEDTGIGIAETKKEKLFQSFSQADSSTTRKFGGSGLGLSISKKIIDLMQGDIQFESEEDKGSSFWFSVVLAKGDAALIESPEINTIDERVGSKRILIAEDNALNRKVAAKILGRVGYLVDTVSNGKEVLGATQLTRYDAILMDCQMPHLDGYQATAVIREREKDTGKHTPIIALTAHAMVSDRKKCLDAGMDEYLSKPFDPKTLRKVIESLTEEKNKALSFSKNARRKIRLKSKRVDVEVLKEVIALKEVDGFAFANELLTLFSKSTPKEIAKLEKALKGKELPKVADIAHSLKSSSGNLGALAFHQLCKTLERAARNGELAKAKKIFSVLRQEFSKTDAELRKEVKSLFAFEKKVA